VHPRKWRLTHRERTLKLRFELCGRKRRGPSVWPGAAVFGLAAFDLQGTLPGGTVRLAKPRPQRNLFGIVVRKGELVPSTRHQIRAAARLGSHQVSVV